MSKSAFRLALAALFIASVRGNNCVKIEFGNKPVGGAQVDGPVPDRIKDHKAVIMAIGVKQQNVQTLEEKLMASADTTKPTYGKHMSNDEVQALTRPAEPHLEAVRKWLASAHAQVLPDLSSSNHDVIVATVSLEGAAHLLHTPYHLFVEAPKSDENGNAIGFFNVGSNSTSICVPEQVYNAVDYISHNIVDKADLAAIGARRRLQKNEATTPGPADFKQGVPISIPNPDVSLSTYVNNPQTTRYLYNMPREEFGDWKSKVAVFEPGAKLSNLLLGFYWNVYCFEGIDCGAEPKTESNPMGYPVVKSTPIEFQFNRGVESESQLDIEAITATATGVHTEFWQVNSYISCPASGAQMSWSRIEFFLRVSNTSDIDVPKAFSDSFGCNAYQPAQMTARVQRRIDTEFMKLGARGISYLVASGDCGVNGGISSNLCPDGKFAVQSPQSFPHITSVGGTQPYAEITPQPGFGFPRPGASSEQSWVIMEPATQGPQLAQTIEDGGFVASGTGGFSNVFPQPAYQKEAVDKYLQKLADAGELPPESRGYNTAMRAYPDISAQAQNYCVNAPSNEQELEASQCTDGMEFEDCKEAALNTFTCGQGGTSAAAPTLTGIIGQLNAARAKVGKGTLGFLNPLIYQHPEVFNDITQGSPSHGCAEHGAGPKAGEPIIPGECAKECQETVKLGKGWYVKEGYDMVTGVGTPDYKKLKELVLNLP